MSPLRFVSIGKLRSSYHSNPFPVFDLLIHKIDSIVRCAFWIRQLFARHPSLAGKTGRPFGQRKQPGTTHRAGPPTADGWQAWVQRPYSKCPCNRTGPPRRTGRINTSSRNDRNQFNSSSSPQFRSRLVMGDLTRLFTRINCRMKFQWKGMHATQLPVN